MTTGATGADRDGGRRAGVPAPGSPQRGFAWQDMFVHPDNDPRATGGIFVHRQNGGPPSVGPEAERATLAGYLRDYRLTLELKCSGLDAAAMARRSVEPSDLSLLGLVRHLSDAERGWFRRVMAGQDAPPRYRSGPGDDHDRAFADATADPEMVAAAWQAWRAEVAFAERFVAESASLDRTGTYDQRGGARPQISLREVMVHMIEEYARHCGHADLLRERIDGRVGL